MSSVARFLKAVCLFVCVFAFGASYAHASVPTQFLGLAQTLGTVTQGGGIAVDPSGNVYVADTVANSVVKITPQGFQITLSITGLSVALNGPDGLALDGSGNLYIADSGNGRIVKVTPSLVGSVVSMGSVTLSFPKGVALDYSGNLFISDAGTNKIVEIPAGGSATTLTLTGAVTSLNTPDGLGTDLSGNLYIVDSVNNRIVKVTAGTSTTTLVSTSGVTLNGPKAIAIDGSGNLFISNSASNSIAMVDISSNGVLLNTYTTTLSNPYGIAVDPFGQIYISDIGDGNVYKASPPFSPTLSTSAEGYSVNRTAVGFGHTNVTTGSTVTIALPFEVGLPQATSVQVLTNGTASLDFQVGAINTCLNVSGSCNVSVSFKPTAPGIRFGAIVLLSGTTPIITVPLYGWGDAPVAAVGGKNTATLLNSGGTATTNPFQIALDGQGNMYETNYGSNTIGKIPAGGGAVTTVSVPGFTLSQPTGIALDVAGNLYIADYGNSRIIVLFTNGTAAVLTISNLSTSLNLPVTLNFDGAGNLYIADYGRGRLVEVTNLVVNGTTATGLGRVIATPGITIATTAMTGMAVSPTGTVYGADRTNSRIFQVTAAGVASVVATPGYTLSAPEGVAVDGMANVYIIDSNNQRVLRITTAGVISAFALTGQSIGSFIFGITPDANGNLYIGDWSNNRIVYVSVATGSLSFASTNVASTSSDSPQIATITNLGNLSMPVTATTGYTTNFVNNTSDASGCLLVASVAAGQTCDLSSKFTPQSAGPLTATITASDNSLNVLGTTQTVTLSGTGIQTADSTATTVGISPTSIVNGQTATITATVTDTQSGKTSTIPTGSVSFVDTVGATITSLNGGTAVALSGTGTATLTGVQLSGIGTHTITANYIGVTNVFQASTNTTTAPVTLTPVTVTGPATQPVQVTVGQTGSAIVTVAGPYTTLAVPSGTISYTILNSSSTSVATGTATLVAGTTNSTATISIPNTLPGGSFTISLTYGGNSNYQATTTPTIITVTINKLVPALTWVPSPSTISYGATLTGALNASAASSGTPVPGTFSYTATPTSGTAAAVTNASVLGVATYSLGTTFTPTDPTTYTTATATVAFTVTQATQTINFTAPTTPVTFGVTPITLVATGGGSGNAVAFSVVSGPATVSGSTLTITGAGSVVIAANQAGNANYSAATQVTKTIVVNQAAQTITFTAPTTPVNLGVTPIALVASGGASGNAVTFTVVSGPATVSGSTLTITGAGSVVVAANQAGNTNYAAATQVTQTVVVNKGTPAIGLASSANPAILGAAITFTATVSSTITTPTGTVSFYYGATLLGTGTMAGGIATFVTTALPLGADSITAVYSGDTNFATVTSSALTETIVFDFTLVSSGVSPGPSTSETVLPGGTASYSLTITPAGGTSFPVATTLTLTGLPAGATATVTPAAWVSGGTNSWTLAANTPLTPLTISIKTAVTSALNERHSPLDRKLPLLAFGLLLLPFSSRMRRAAKRAGRTISLLLLVAASLAAVAGLTGCGTTNGFFGQSAQSYVVTETITSGGVSHSSTITLNVQ